jgi:hypothetical protein
MKSTPVIKEKDEMPEFMEDEWLASALKELESGKLSPDERAILEIEIAHEMFNRSAVELMVKYKFEEGIETTLKANIERIMIKYPEWTNEHISDLLQAPLALVKKVRATLASK